MRYIIHLLPDKARRRAFDALRDRVAAMIGPNRALDYPTAHVTLVWAIQDTPDDPAPIAQADLLAALERWRGTGAIPLTIAAPVETREHLLLPLDDTTALAALRNALYRDAVRAAGGRNAERAERAERVREQTWPHLTFAQEIEPARWEQGMAVLAAEGGDLPRAPFIGAELALIGRDIDAGEPYRIIGRVPLS